MKAFLNITLVLLAMLALRGMASAQSVEAYAGHRRAGVDLMWFKYFRDRNEGLTPFLFFSRNRASVDYENSPAAFGSTNAVSWNSGSGLGIVAVASFLNAGFTPKAGLQLYKQKGAFMFFGWLVADLKRKGNVDLFGLFRYQPRFSEHWAGFGQLELFPVYNPSSGLWNLTQRLRLGAKHRRWAAGLMADFNQTGKTAFTQTQNAGVFLRYEF